jgi:hypothetical protein
MRPLCLVLFVAVVYITTVAAVVNYEYDQRYTVTSDVTKCQPGANSAYGRSDFGCFETCRGIAVDGECVCVACDEFSTTKSAAWSLGQTTATGGEATVLHTPAFTMDIGAAVFPTNSGQVTVDVYDQNVVFGVTTTQVQVSGVFVFRRGMINLNHVVGITINYSEAEVYPGWIPFVYTFNMTSGLWYDIGGSVSYGDGTIYFETDTFLQQYVVVASSKSGSLLAPRSFYGRVCDCDPTQELEISMPCSSVSDVVCKPPRLFNEMPKKQFTLTVTLPAQDPSTIDEYLYRAALAQLSHVDFRDIAVSSVDVE